MKILVVSQYYYPEPFRINDICEELVQRGHDVTVLTGIPNYPDGFIYKGYEKGRKEEIINGVKVLRCKIRPRKQGSFNLLLNYISFWIRSRFLIRMLPNSFDVVYSYQLSPITSCSAACWYSKKYNKPHFLYCLDLWPESIIENVSPHSIIYKLIARLSKSIYSKADIIGVTSPSFINYLSSLINWPREKFVYIPQHALDIAPQSKVERHNHLNIVFTGNIGASQNLDVLVDAVNNVKNEKGFEVIIVGSGSDLERLKRKVEKLGLEHLIKFTGRQPKEKMKEYYSLADFCFLSLRDEGAVSWTIPGKLQEYMSASKPVLAAINGDAKFVIDEANCGVCVGCNDVLGLSNALVYYSNEKKSLKLFGENARSYYVSHFTLRNHVDSLELELERLCNKNL